MAAQPAADDVGARTALVPLDFAVTARSAGRVVIVTVQGECDLSRTEDLRIALDAALDDGGTTGLIVDLSEAELFDSTSLGTLMAAWKKAQRLGTPVLTVATNPSVLLPFEIAGLVGLLMVVGSLGEAFAALRRSEP